MSDVEEFWSEFNEKIRRPLESLPRDGQAATDMYFSQVLRMLTVLSDKSIQFLLNHPEEMHYIRARGSWSIVDEKVKQEVTARLNQILTERYLLEYEQPTQNT